MLCLRPRCPSLYASSGSSRSHAPQIIVAGGCRYGVANNEPSGGCVVASSPSPLSSRVQPADEGKSPSPSLVSGLVAHRGMKTTVPGQSKPYNDLRVVSLFPLIPLNLNIRSQLGELWFGAKSCPNFTAPSSKFLGPPLRFRAGALIPSESDGEDSYAADLDRWGEEGGAGSYLSELVPNEGVRGSGPGLLRGKRGPLELEARARLWTTSSLATTPDLVAPLVCPRGMALQASEGGSSYGSRGRPPDTTGRAVPLTGFPRGFLEEGSRPRIAAPAHRPAAGPTSTRTMDQQRLRA
ncbi:hypothetical protein THAOC_19705 [Thalassiosira oceanica]|uniref:Uncharacterized protein n=1 Tax=Thalassiosira oceanica TaxID=159749 RepID=K0S407_THAOC|nr:hypothetical protein THAOC_19705 [Thalassiosira oceanica]|eukprot:EJK60015.1 hypothetical protein THAOC_19705 [Thalassiosira oceanica]